MGYGSVSAKVKAMRGRLLSAEDYYKLCSSANVHEAGLTLRNFPEYTQTVDSLIARGSDNRHMYEQRLISVLDNNYFKIHGFLTDTNVKKYLDACFIKREIQIIKYMLGNFYDKRDKERNISYTQGFRFFDIDINTLGRAETIEEFLDILGKNKFFHIVKDAYEDNQSLFEMEIALDFNYYRNLWKARKKFLKGDDLKAAAIIDGTEADMQNILWIYRLKSYYSMNGESLYKYVMPLHYRIGPESITRLAEADLPAMKDILLEMPYAYAFENAASVERAYYTAINKAYRQAQSRYPNSAAVILDYLFLKNMEIKNIISIFEGVRYAMEPDEIMERIFMQAKEQVRANA